MEVINPELEEIEGMVYRLNVSDDYNAIKDAATIPYVEYGEEDEVGCAKEIVDDEKLEVEIQYLNDGRFQLSFHVPNVFYPYLIGSRGGTKQRLESDTHAYIDIPKHGETGDVVITGRRKEDICNAYRRIKILIATCRSQKNLTHFHSLPMTSVEIINSFQRFKQDVLSNCQDCQGINENLFISPNRLHLTLGVMMLADEEERNEAINTFLLSKQRIVDPIFRRKSVRVRVRGIGCMCDDYSKVRVLFAEIENGPSKELLQQLADSMVNFFVDRGISKKERDSVKLHMTLMNVRYAETELDRHTKRKRPSFDATKIFELYKDYDFGEVEIHSIHLSQMHSTAEDGYYQSSCKMTFF